MLLTHPILNDIEGEGSTLYSISFGQIEKYAQSIIQYI